MSEHKPLMLRIDRYIVDRGKEKIRIDVPEHEVPILRMAHGDPANVRLIEQDVDIREFNPSAPAEYDRLVAAYKRVNAPNPAETIYREGAAALLRFGFELTPSVVANPEAERVSNPREEAHRKAREERNKGRAKAA